MGKKISSNTLPVVFDASMTADGVPVYTGFEYDASVAPKVHKAHKGYQKCAHSHPPLLIEVTGKDQVYTVYGGACGDPIHTGLDIYVALDHGTAHDPQAWPWHGSRQFIYFPISDMSVPKDVTEFKLMIEWLCDQIVAGKSVHVGCIGGHGRTGMVLAALVRMLGGVKDAITYVRGHYCEKAVETTAQADWLAKHFDITAVRGAKAPKSYHSAPAMTYSGSGRDFDEVLRRAPDLRVNKIAKEYSGEVVEIKPFTMTGNIWGTV